jgi:hypothetical protein
MIEPGGSGTGGFGGTGHGGLLYGPVIRDKIKLAGLETLQAYRAVAHDMLKDGTHADSSDLRASLAELDEAIAAKMPKK